MKKMEILRSDGERKAIKWNQASEGISSGHQRVSRCRFLATLQPLPFVQHVESTKAALVQDTLKDKCLSVDPFRFSLLGLILGFIVKGLVWFHL